MLMYDEHGKVRRITAVYDGVPVTLCAATPESLATALDAAHAAIRQAFLDEDPLLVLRMYLEKAGVPE